MFKNVDLLIKRAVNFALYRLPNQQEPILIIGQEAETKSVASIVGLNDLSGFIIAPFKPTPNTPIVCIQPERIIKGFEDISNYLRELSNTDTDKETEQAEIKSKYGDYYPAYRTAFDTFIDVLLTRRFQKLVLSRPFEYENANNISLGHILEKALDAYPTSFVYLCHTQQTGTWLGSSPELLLEGQGNRWKTVALAGTQSVEESSENYSWDNKNRYEQQLVTDVKQLLDNLKLQYTQDNSHTVRIGKLIHLKTGFSFQLNDSILVGELLDKLHPTPAICGLPKSEAYHFIIANEGYDRSYYSGFIGYLDRNKQTNLYVNLRCMKVEQDRFRLYAGGGLLPTSELNSEWEETNAKLQTMLSLLK